MGKLVYFKWMVEDTKVLKENLTTEQIGELFIAVMDYLQTGTVAEVSKEIRFPYADYRNRVDRACSSYNEICSKRAENGKKGGKAKAENSAKNGKADPYKKTKFSPPTLQQFKNAVSRIIEDNDYGNIESYDIEAFFDELKEKNWEFYGIVIQSRKDWERIIDAKFHDPMSEYSGMKNLNISYFSVFSYIAYKYPQIFRFEEDTSELIWELFDSWKEDHFDIKGVKFAQSEFADALDKIAPKYIDDSQA